MAIIKQQVAKPFLKRPVAHGFPRAIAKVYGAKAATVLRHLAHKVRKSTKERDGKRWTYNPLTELSKKSFPYIPPSTLGVLLKEMEAVKLIEIGKFNKWAHDRTQWFHVPQPNLDDAEKDLIMFDVKVAVAHGLPEAVLITNLRYFLTSKVLKKKPPYEHEMSPTALATLLPMFSKQTIKRALTTLKKAGLIIKVSKTKPIYTLPSTDEDIGSFLVGMSPKLVDEVQNETGKVQNET